MMTNPTAAPVPEKAVFFSLSLGGEIKGPPETMDRLAQQVAQLVRDCVGRINAVARPGVTSGMLTGLTPTPINLATVAGIGGTAYGPPVV